MEESDQGFFLFTDLVLWSCPLGIDARFPAHTFKVNVHAEFFSANDTKDRHGVLVRLQDDKSKVVSGNVRRKEPCPGLDFRHSGNGISGTCPLVSILQVADVNALHED
jgi:hypothetical protein